MIQTHSILKAEGKCYTFHETLLLCTYLEKSKVKSQFPKDIAISRTHWCNHKRLPGVNDHFYINTFYHNTSF